jgi:hypothetical protein
MQKQLRIITRKRLAICPYSHSFFTGFAAVSSLAFSKHLGRLPQVFSVMPGVQVFQLPCGWLVWRYPSGRRLLAALPF